MQSTHKNILPIVILSSPEEKKSFLERWFLPTLPNQWQDYAYSKDIKKDANGKFVVVQNLKKFLSPYQTVINEPPPSICKFTIFFSFFTQLEADVPAEIKELHLAKMVALLQLLADPNLRGSPYHFRSNFLWCTFNNKQSGLDILHLLFSYGLDYNKFLSNFSAFLKKHTGVVTTQESLLEILTKQTNEKDNIAQEKLNIVYRPMLDVLPDDEHIQAYHLLSDAYSYYKKSDYSQASSCYSRASLLLDKFASQEGLNRILREDYQTRRDRSIYYQEECDSLLLSHENQPEKTNYSSIFGIWNAQPVDIQNDPLLDRKNK